MLCFSFDWLPGPMRGVWTVVALALLLPVPPPAEAQNNDYDVTIARVQYGGGGDWYTGSQTLVTLVSFVREHTLLDVAPTEDNVELSSSRLYQYPFLYLTGHGNVFFSERDARALRRYLEQGGFLHVDDDYGLDEHIRREMQKVFPDQEFVELPFDHPIYRSHYRFASGLPKVHEHDGVSAPGQSIQGDILCVAIVNDVILAWRVHEPRGSRKAIARGDRELRHLARGMEPRGREAPSRAAGQKAAT